MARPLTITPQQREQLCDLLKRGHYLESACSYVGIRKERHYDWLERASIARADKLQGKKLTAAQQTFIEYADAVEIARSYGEAWLVEQLLHAAADPKGKGQWTAYMTVLERTRPDRWRRPPSMPQGPSSPATLTFDPQKLSADELDALEALLIKAKPGEQQDA